MWSFHASTTVTAEVRKQSAEREGTTHAHTGREHHLSHTSFRRCEIKSLPGILYATYLPQTASISDSSAATCSSMKRPAEADSGPGLEVHACAHAHTNVSLYKHTCTWRYKQIHTHARMNTHTRTPTMHKQTWISHTHLHAHAQSWSRSHPDSGSRTHSHNHNQGHKATHTHTCTIARACSYTSSHAHARTHVYPKGSFHSCSTDCNSLQSALQTPHCVGVCKHRSVRSMPHTYSLPQSSTCTFRPVIAIHV